MRPPGKDRRAIDEPAFKVESRAGTGKCFRIASQAAVQSLVTDERTISISAQDDGFASFDIPVADLRDGAHPTGHLRCYDKIEVGRRKVNSLIKFCLQTVEVLCSGDAFMTLCA